MATKESDAEFRSGDKVRLRSGGPTMTVRGYVIENQFLQTAPVVSCSFFDDHGELHAAHFPPACLEQLVDEERTLKMRTKGARSGDSD